MRTQTQLLVGRILVFAGTLLLAGAVHARAPRASSDGTDMPVPDREHVEPGPREAVPEAEEGDSWIDEDADPNVPWIGPDGEMYDPHDDTCDDPDCELCNASPRERYARAQRPRMFPVRFWAQTDYLLWVTRGMSLPPLVTASPDGTPQREAGVLGLNTTSTLFGGSRIHDQSVSGGRIRLGAWLNNCQTLGVGGEYFALGQQETHFTRDGGSNPILARPFFNALTETNDAELVNFPNLLRGRVTVDATTRLQGAAAHGLINCWCDQGCGTNLLGPARSVHAGSRLDFLAGYRFMRLDDGLAVREDLVSLDRETPGAFVVRDQFTTRNEFHGADVGFILYHFRGRWSLEVLSRVALGNTHQTVTIDGSTDITNGGGTTHNTGGLLAQRTNIGTYMRDRFGAIPEFGFVLGYQLTPRWRARVGYTIIYWNRVIRPGNAIDPTVNTNLLPPEAVPFTGPLRPAFAFSDSRFWAQGLTAGLEFRF